MSGVVPVVPRFRFNDANGNPLSNGSVTVYAAGTTILVNTYRDSALTTLNTNPVNLDANGECLFWTDGTTALKFLLTTGPDGTGSTVTGWPVDNIPTIAPAAFISVKSNGAVGDGVTDDTTAIQTLIDRYATSPYGATIYLPVGTYLLSSSLKLARSITLQGAGKDCTILKLSGDHAAIEQKMLSSGTVGAQNIGVFDLQILGTSDATKTAQHGIYCSSSLQYSTFERILIKEVGGVGIYAPVTTLGAIFNSFRDIEIHNPRGDGAYLCGNFGQNIFERVRIFGGYSDGFVFDGTNNAGSNPVCNTFIGCAYESTNNTTGDVYGVNFLSDTLYNAYNTNFIDCYMEPKGRSVGDTMAYRIGAAKGVNIVGGIITFAHWGVQATCQFSEGISVQGVSFIQSTTWGGATNLTGKAMLSCQNASARIHVGAQCSAQLVGGVTWDTTDTGSVGRVHGFLGFQDKLKSGKELTFSAPASLVASRPVANAARAGEMYLSMGAAGFADHLDVCIKQANDVYAWVPLGSNTDYKGTIPFPGVTVNAGATQSLIVATTGADLGRFVRVAPLVDIAGMTMSVSCSSSGNIRITFTNPTAGNITLAAGSWPYMVQV